MEFSTAIFLVLMIALAEGGSEYGAENHRIAKRSTHDLGKAIACTQGKSLWFSRRLWAAYNYGFYGCYCGFGGKGKPVDATDRCCKKHDECWDSIEDRRENVPSLYTLSYDYTCRSQQIFCHDSDGVKRDLCECDRTFSLCLKENRNTYDTKYRFHHRHSNC